MLKFLWVPGHIATLVRTLHLKIHMGRNIPVVNAKKITTIKYSRHHVPVNLRENGSQIEGQTFFAVWPYRTLFLCQKRRKNIITRFREHSPNKFHGVSLVYIHVTFATCPILEEYNSVTEYMYTGFWWESLGERDRLVKTGVDGWIVLKCISSVN